MGWDKIAEEIILQTISTSFENLRVCFLKGMLQCFVSRLVCEFLTAVMGLLVFSLCYWIKETRGAFSIIVPESSINRIVKVYPNSVPEVFEVTGNTIHFM